MKFEVIYDTEERVETTPENMLLINILDRAMRDLKELDPAIHREAYHWFQKRKNTMHLGYVSYQDILDVVDIGAERLGKIKRLLHEYNTRTLRRVPFKHSRNNLFQPASSMPHRRIALVK